ncbi:MAG: FAD-dependent oxidoreductase [Candidatus Kaistia colombiensis]|nr:MAG: FAD-dependent oxidoreductase [Kaistia sp.]
MSLPAPPLARARMEAEIAADSRFDVVVIGGGITGAGTFRDLAMQGLRVLLVERGDFASGASGALTRVAHGGFRYLERGEIELVRESVEERDRLIANAPHAVRPIRVVLPLRSRFGGLFAAPLRFLRLLPGHGLPGIVPMAIGARLYDALAGRSPVLPRSGVAAGKSARRRFPYLDRKFAGAVWTYEGRIHAPERVAIELVEDGVASGGGSAALNYCRLVAAEGTTLHLENQLSGQSFSVTARAVVNAAGAHADKVAALFGIREKMTGGIAGIHLILDAPELAARLGDDLFFFEDNHDDPAKRRLCVVYRLADDRVLLGTTEWACDDPDTATATEADERYLLDALAAALPDVALSRDTVVAHLIGVRPVVRSKEANLANRSRSHAIFRHEANKLPVVTIVGGKWTTFRRMAEDTTDTVLQILGRRRSVSTRDLAIGGGKPRFSGGDGRQQLAEALQAAGIEPVLAARLIETYGSRAATVAEWILAHGADPISDDGRLTRGEVAFFRDAELAVSADDIIRRRTDQYLRAPDREALARRLELCRESTG